MYEHYDDEVSANLRQVATITSKPIPNEEGLEQEPYLWNVPYQEVCTNGD